MPFSSSKLSRDAFLSRYFPHYHPVVSPACVGLSGGSCIIAYQARRLVLRQHHDATVADYHFRRHYRALRSLPASLAPRVFGCYPGWMVVEYLPGESLASLPAAGKLAALLHHLHCQRRFGWRVHLLPLLERYWQFSDPSRRTPLWLRMLKHLRREGEPHPLRLAPLHMDVHAGNVIVSGNTLRLIDWEYAGDGDVALELAAVWSENHYQQRTLLDAYSERACLPRTLLEKQVKRWRKWVVMLMAGWYEYRWQQTGDQQFIALADHSWGQLMNKKVR